jgi:hypothetical protein
MRIDPDSNEVQEFLAAYTGCPLEKSKDLGKWLANSAAC